MTAPRVVALSGGVGGAKLALGLYRLLPPDHLALLVNTGDDFRHLTLSISPDLDTAMYTLAGLAHPQEGWGRRDEHWNCHETLSALGAPDWFRLGDRDLATHLFRSEQLAAGMKLSTVAARLCQSLRLRATIWPMSDDPVPTVLQTELGELSFQQYFVQRRCAPRVHAIRFPGSRHASGVAAAVAALRSADTQLIVICPSNPFLSIDPILAIPDLRAALTARRAPCVAVSPLVGGLAVKGPTAKLMVELGLPLSAASIARHYHGLIDGLVCDNSDPAVSTEISVPVLRTDTLMRDLDDRLRVARATLVFAHQLSRPFAPVPRARPNPWRKAC